MFKNPIFVLLVVMSISTVNAQQLSVSVSGFCENKAYLYSLQGEKVTSIDSLTSIAEGKLTYNLNHNP